MGNFVSPSMVNKLRLSTKPIARSPKIIFPNGEKAACEEQITDVPLQMGHYKDRLTLKVAPWTSYDVILGKPWLARLNPHINWVNNTMVLTRQGQRILVRPSMPAMRKTSTMMTPSSPMPRSGSGSRSTPTPTPQQLAVNTTIMIRSTKANVPIPAQGEAFLGKSRKKVSPKQSPNAWPLERSAEEGSTRPVHRRNPKEWTTRHEQREGKRFIGKRNGASPKHVHFYPRWSRQQACGLEHHQESKSPFDITYTRDATEESKKKEKKRKNKRTKQ